jgi:tetratricopeptide (TPR) repeat protein
MRSVRLVAVILFCFTWTAGIFAQEKKNETETEADKLFQQGYDLNNKGKYDEAIDAFKKSIQSDPNHLRANVYLGVAMMGKEDFENAIGQLKKAIALDEKYPLTNYALSVCYARKSNPDVTEAKKYVEIAKNNGYHVPPWFFDFLKRIESGQMPGQTTQQPNADKQPPNEDSN